MRVAVVGAGIGGLVTAVGLQADGHAVTVYEQREEPGALGAGLTLFGNAFAALDAVGLGDLVRQVSSDAAGRLRSGQRHPSGRWLLSLPSSDAPAIRSLHRADLHQVLVDNLDGGALRLGQKVRVSPDGAPTLTLPRGEEHFDLVVAADGLRSDARTRWGLDRGVRYAGYTAWRGVTASSGHLADEAGETWGRGARFGIVPLPDERVYWFATCSAPPDADLGEDQAVLHELFGSWHRPIVDLLDATQAADVLRHDIYDLEELPPSFVTGRGVLLGDAAHAMTPDLGQGAGQAIEDAATLIWLLRTVDTRAPEGALRTALHHYDQTRRPRTRALWRQSRRAGQVAQLAAPLAAGLRDTALRLTPPLLMTRAMSRFQDWAAPAPPHADG